MSTTKKILIAVIVIIILGIGALWYTSAPVEQNGEVTTGKFNIRNFLPFGDESAEEETSTPTNNTPTGTGQNNGDFGSQNNSVVKLRKIWDKPVVGAVFVGTGSTTVRLVEKSTGNVHEIDMLGKARRLTNETLPRIGRMFWLSDGSGFISQSADEHDTIETSFVKLSLASGTSTEALTPYKTTISKLPIGIRELTISPDNKKIFYLVDESGAAGYTSNPDGTGSTKVFTHFLNEWIPQWFDANKVLLASKASNEYQSVGIVLNLTNKTTSNNYTGITGASALMRKDGQYILLGTGGVPNLLLKGTSSSTITSLNQKVLPEKCVWDTLDNKFVYCAVPKFANSNNYPDAWYQGLVETDDMIERINVFDQYALIVSDLKTDSGKELAATNLQVSKDGKFMIFTNQTDSSLWLLSL